MSAIDVPAEAGFGLRTEQGGPPARAPETTDGGEALWGAAFRQSNSVVSALQYMRNSGRYAPVPDYNPVKEIKGWGDPKYFLTHGQKFVGSQSPAETLAIKSQIDQEETDRRTAAAGGVIGVIASMGANLLDPTILMPGGVGIDAIRGGFTFSKAVVPLAKAGFAQTAAQEALLHATQQTRTFEESAINVASGTMLTALIGGAAVRLLSPAERIVLERQVGRDRVEINQHAGNPMGPLEDIAPDHEFNVPAYHGTNDVISKFDPQKTRLDRGVFFSDQPDMANKFAHGLATDSDAAHFPDEPGFLDWIKPLVSDKDFKSIAEEHAKHDAAMAEMNKHEPDSPAYLKAQDEYTILSRQLNEEARKVSAYLDHETGEYTKAPNVTPVRLRLGKTHEVDMGGKFEWGVEGEAIDYARANGYDSVTLKNYGDGPDRKIYSVLDSRNIRNRFYEEELRKPAPAAGTGMAMAAGAAATDTRQIELVPFGLDQIPGVRTVVEKTSPMQRLFGADSVSARRAAADLAETSLLTKENLEGKVTTAGPALDREARLMIHQGQVAVGDELSSLFSQYRFGEQKTVPRARAFVGDVADRFGIGGNGGPAIEPKMSFSEFKEAVSDAMRAGDQHEILQVQQAAQTIRNKIFEPWKKRAIEAGLLPEGVDVKTADSYLQRLYNKQAIAAKRPEFVDRVTDWLQGDQQAKVQAQEKIGLYHGAMRSHEATIEKTQGQIAKLEKDADVIAARQEETTRFNKAANRRSEQLRESQYRNEGGIRVDVPGKGIERARGGALFETLARERGNLLADRASAKLAEIERLEQRLAAETANRDAMRAKIEDEIGRWEGKSTTEAKAALKAREQAETVRQAKIEAGESSSKGERLSSADKAVDRAVNRILESDRTLSRDELRSRAHEITDRIIGAPDGRLPYDLGMEHGTAFGGSGEAPRGALAAREFNIPDATIRDFLDNDIEHIVATHLRTMVPDVLLTEKFGDTRMTEAFRKINDEYAALSDAAKSEKERTRLEKERQGVIDDLAAVRDRIRGIYGISADQPMRNAARAVAVLKNYNVLTSMGSAALSSLPDMAGVVMRHGMVNAFNDAWVPFFNMLTRQSDVWQEAGRQYRAMGIAVESVLASRHHALTDTLDTYHPQSRVERTMQWATGKFQFANMLAPWTDFAKVNASLVSGSEILRATKAAAEGKITARQLRTLGESGIEPHMADRIAKAFEDGGEVRDGVHLPNTAEWTDKEARRVFEGAVARDVDISVITPGQEKPLWMSHPILSVIGQFKSFTAAATERILISSLQRRDAQVLQGMMFSMGLGMLSYKIGSLTGGQPTSDKPQDWIKEAISKGGILGWFEEGNALASKATRGGVDVYRLIGADKPLTRYASRSAMDQILGPTAGKIGGILSVASAASKPSEWSESDSKALRRLVAGQNVFYLRGLFNQVEAAGNDAFGIEMKVKPQGH